MHIGFGWLVLSCMESFGSNTKLLDKLGILGNVNRPEIWEDQLGGYMTGGSIHASVPVSSLELVTLDPPSFNAGCGGINAYFGGFGYINGRQLEELFKNIGSNALSFGTMLTMKTLSPLISDLLENLEAMARFMNSQNINSCQMGASIASGLFPKNEHAQRLACQARKMGGDSSVGAAASNYFTARYDCSDGLQMRATNSGKGDNMLPLEYNLVWLALSKECINLSAGGKEFLMGLSGTVIARETSGGSLKLEHKKSLMLDNKLLHALIFGSNLGSESLERYSCSNDDDCLSPVIVKSNMKPEDTMIFKVSRIIESIASKILSENAGSTEELQPEEKHLITKSSIHILKLISLNAGLKGHGVSHTVEDYAESIAFDYVIGYLDSLLNFVYQALGNMEHAQMEGDQIKSFKEEIRYIKQMLFNERVKAFERLNTLLAVKQRTQQIENMVFASFAQYRSTGE